MLPARYSMEQSMKSSFVSLFSFFFILILFRPGTLADDIARPCLDFHVNFSNIFAQHAKTDKLYTSHKTDHTDGTCPSGHRSAAAECCIVQRGDYASCVGNGI